MQQIGLGAVPVPAGLAQGTVQRDDQQKRDADRREQSELNLRCTQAVLTAAAATGVRRVVLLTSAMVYGALPDNDVPLAEDAPLRPVTPYAESKVRVEDELFALADAETPFWILMVALFLRGVGLGIVIIPLMAVAFIGLEHDEIPHASIVTRVSQQIGGSLGVALLAVILATAATAAADLASGFDIAFWWTVGFSALAVVVSLVLPGRHAQHSANAPAESVEEVEV